MLIQLNDELIALGKPIQILRHLHPINAAEEREKFFAALTRDQVYNPRFEYNPPSFDIRATREQLDQLKLDSVHARYGLPIKPLLSFANEIEFSLKLVEACSTESFARWAAESYGVPTERLLKKATQLLEDESCHPQEETNISADDLKIRFEQKLHSYGLTHWIISFRDTAAARISVSPNEQTIWILSSAQFSPKDVARLLAHEIDTHVLRAANGALQPYYKVLATGLQNYIETEEGIATLNESLNETLDVETLRTYALRTLAVAWSQQASFYATYLKLTQYAEPSPAYDLALRVKRGLGDTTQPGGFPKDYLYFSGYEKLQEYYTKQNDLSLLYVGKVGLNDLAYIAQLVTEGLIEPAVYLPPYYR